MSSFCAGRPSRSSHHVFFDVAVRPGPLPRRSRYHQVVVVARGWLRLPKRQPLQSTMARGGGCWLPAGEGLIVADAAAGSRVHVLLFRPERAAPPRCDRVRLFQLAEGALGQIERLRARVGRGLPRSHWLAQLALFQRSIPAWMERGLPLQLPRCSHAVLGEVVRAVESGLPGAVCLDDLSRELGLSPRSIQRLFKAEMDLSFRRYVQLARLMIAADVLRKSDHSVADACEAAGYQSLSSFSRHFRRVIGVGPSLYRGVEVGSL